MITGHPFLPVKILQVIIKIMRNYDVVESTGNGTTITRYLLAIIILMHKNDIAFKKVHEGTGIEIKPGDKEMKVVRKELSFHYNDIVSNFSRF
jgi:hypothetical protein